jgi:hypothetical protein
MKILLLVFAVVNVIHFSFSFSFLRFKRDAAGDLFGQLTQVVNQLVAPLAGPPKPSQTDPSFNSGPGSGSNNLPPKSGSGPPQKALGDVVGYCDQSPQACSYLACMGSNFKNNDNLKSGSKVLADPDLRSAIANDPAILREACEKAGLNDNGCANFKMILGFADKIDPKSLHTHDEPRNKRSPVDDYGDHGGGSPKSSSSSNSNSASAHSSSNSGSSKSSSSLTINSKPSGKGSSDYDYEHSHGGGSSKSSSHTAGSSSSSGQGQGSGGQQKDCEAMMIQGNNGNSNGNNNNNNNNFNNNNGNSKGVKSRAQARRVNNG